MEANNTAPAEVSFEILAKILNSFFTTKSTIDSIAVSYTHLRAHET